MVPAIMKYLNMNLKWKTTTVRRNSLLWGIKITLSPNKIGEQIFASRFLLTLQEVKL